MGAIKTIDRLDTPLSARVEMDVAVRLNDSITDDAAVKVRLYGPGDVTGFGLGFDAKPEEKRGHVILRTDPPHLTTNFEPNYFPVVEFKRSDFPWLFTPAKANSDEQLRPWICLVAVEKRDNLKADPRRPLSVLTANAKTDLPDRK